MSYHISRNKAKRRRNYESLKNDHIIEMAKKFIDNCNSFEIKDLDADKQYLNNLPVITPFTDRIKEY